MTRLILLCSAIASALAIAIGVTSREARASDTTWADLRATINVTISDPVQRAHYVTLTDQLEAFDLAEDIVSYDATMDAFTEDLALSGEVEPPTIPVVERETVYASLSSVSLAVEAAKGGGRTTTETESTEPDQKCKDRKTATCETKVTRNCVIKVNKKNGVVVKRWCETT